MVTLQISDSLAGTIQREAETRGLSIEDFLSAAVRRERTQAERQKIEQEQEWWFSQPLRTRAKYQGESVAIHNKKLVDHDKDKKVLYQRVRERYGKTPVLIIPTEGPRDIRVFSPRLVRS
jgi:hypothetical protein